MEGRLSEEERQTLLSLARRSLTDAVNGKRFVLLEPGELSENLRQEGASFVTLTRNGELRGCIGALEAYTSLAEDVCEHAAAAGLQDYRFPAVRPEELEHIAIEISRLTPPVDLEYENPDDLLAKLRPGIDGVTLREGRRRATFLPQVWQKIPDKVEFLRHLCLKMGVSADAWQKKKLHVQTYQVEEFHE